MKEKIKKSKILEWVYTYGYSLYILYFLYLIFMTINNTNISSYVPFAIAILIITGMLLYVIKMFKELDKSDPTFIDILYLILLVIMITLFLSYLLGSINFSVYNFKLVGTQDGWLNVAGALGGGAMTLLGVWYTIRKQNEIQENNNKRHEQERKEELAIQYRPFISNVKVFAGAHEKPLNSISFLKDTSQKNNSKDEFNDSFEFHIELENIGRGLLCNLTFKDVQLSKNDILNGIQFTETFIGTISPNDPKYINLLFSESLIDSNLYKPGDETEIILNFTATDEFDYKQYCLKIILIFFKKFIDINQKVNVIGCRVSKIEMTSIQ